MRVKRMHSAIFQKAVGSRGSACERPRCGKQRVGAGAVVGDWQGESRSQSRVPQEESPLSSSAEDEIFPFKERRREQEATLPAGVCRKAANVPRRNVRRPATNFLRTAKPSSYPRSTTHRVVHGVPRCDA